MILQLRYDIHVFYKHKLITDKILKLYTMFLFKRSKLIINKTLSRFYTIFINKVKQQMTLYNNYLNPKCTHCSHMAGCGFK